MVEDCAHGYPRLAAFLSSDKSFSIYRGFDYLQSRVLLGLQDQIAFLERKLDQKDSFDEQNGLTARLRSRARDEHTSRRDGEEPPRDRIFYDIRRKVVEYGRHWSSGPPAWPFLTDLCPETNFSSKRGTSFHFKSRQ